ncbi:MAG: hypothetical protein E7199_07140 [Schwartzia succinivorans]|nr:hypothetical protein [Schwartzia succinivorans]
MKEVIIVIPIYRETLSVCEQISLSQVRRILGRYPICFVAPEKMRRFLTNKGCVAEFFPDKCLSSRLEYSKLLLVPDFYARFKHYQYMLLYQLDAFVFFDRLHHFCSLGYDFIGAPMPYSSNFKTKVGINGGLALRKNDSCIRVTQMLQKMNIDSKMRQVFKKAEDRFFSYCGGSEDIPFSVPRVAISSDFSIEFNVAHCWDRLSSEHLPFGCHAWSKSVYFELWRPYIEPFVGKEMMDKAAEEVFANGTMDYYKDWIFPSIARYLIKRIMREGRRTEICAGLQTYFQQDKPIAIWGYGAVGKRCLELFAFAGISIQQIFDKNASGYCADGKIPIIPPDNQAIQPKKYIIIVSTTKYYEEIARYLSDGGLKEGADFFSYREIETYLVRNYYLPIWKRYIEN